MPLTRSVPVCGFVFLVVFSHFSTTFVDVWMLNNLHVPGLMFGLVVGAAGHCPVSFFPILLMVSVRVAGGATPENLHRLLVGVGWSPCSDAASFEL